MKFNFSFEEELGFLIMCKDSHQYLLTFHIRKNAFLKRNCTVKVCSHKMPSFNAQQIGLFFAMKWMLISTFTISDEITYETDFYYKRLSMYPSKLATIEYHISYHQSNFLQKYSGCKYPVFDIYTKDDDENLKRRCSHIPFGQLRNGYLNTPLESRERPYGFTTCQTKEENSDVVQCHGKTFIQDFIPRNYGFSFGCRCFTTGQRPSLVGLMYNISIYDQSNKTKCTPIAIMERQYFTEYCSSLYLFMS